LRPTARGDTSSSSPVGRPACCSLRGGLDTRNPGNARLVDLEHHLLLTGQQAGRRRVHITVRSCKPPPSSSPRPSLAMLRLTFPRIAARADERVIAESSSRSPLWTHLTLDRDPERGLERQFRRENGVTVGVESPYRYQLIITTHCTRSHWRLQSPGRMRMSRSRESRIPEPQVSTQCC
jgi:hypothetical protein